MLIAIREEMARDADFDVDLFVEMARSGKGFERSEPHSMTDHEDERKPPARAPNFDEKR